MECKIRFINTELKNAFEELKEKNPQLHKELERAFSSICNDAFFGRRVKKELIPKELKIKYNINNLWIYDLSGGWRLIYSLVNDDIELISIVLYWMNHKDYERLFKF